MDGGLFSVLSGVDEGRQRLLLLRILCAELYKFCLHTFTRSLTGRIGGGRLCCVRVAVNFGVSL